jgi:hypothetical protein
MVNGRWSMVNGQWSMVNGQWSINQIAFKVKRLFYFFSQIIILIQIINMCPGLHFKYGVDDAIF